MTTRNSRNRPTLTAADIAAATQAYPILGFVLSWYVRGVQVDYADLEALLELAGFSEYMPSKPTKRNALRRGIESWLRARGAVRGGVGADEDAHDVAATPTTRSDVQERVLVRVSSPSSSDYTVFAVVTEEVDMSTLGFTHDTDLRFLLHKKSGAVTPTTDRRGVEQVTQSDRILAEIQPFWEAAKRMIVGRDISRMLVEVVESLGPINMGIKGGCYFVLAEHKEAVERLSRLVAALPTTYKYKPFVTVLGVPDEDQWRRQLTKATKVKLDAELHALEIDLQRFVDAKPGTVKAETIAARLLDYQQLKERAVTYSDLLGLWTQDIERGVERLRAAASAVLTSDALVTAAATGVAADASESAPTMVAVAA